MTDAIHKVLKRGLHFVESSLAIDHLPIKLNSFLKHEPEIVDITAFQTIQERSDFLCQDFLPVHVAHDRQRNDRKVTLEHGLFGSLRLFSKREVEVNIKRLLHSFCLITQDAGVCKLIFLCTLERHIRNDRTHLFDRLIYQRIKFFGGKLCGKVEVF